MLPELAAELAQHRSRLATQRMTGKWVTWLAKGGGEITDIEVV
jgi:hypothetical protein